MKKVFVMTFIAGLAFAAQAGEMKWGWDNSQEGYFPGADVMADVPQDMLMPLTDLAKPGRANSLMEVLYNATFAPLVDGIIGSAQTAAVMSGSLSADEEDVAYVVSPGSFNPFAADSEEVAEWRIVPEPSSVMLLALGGIAVLFRRRRR